MSAMMQWVTIVDAEKFKKAFEDRGYTFYRFGKESGICSRSTLRRAYEEKRINKDTAYKICGYFGMDDVGELIGHKTYFEMFEDVKVNFYDLAKSVYGKDFNKALKKQLSKKNSKKDGKKDKKSKKGKKKHKK